MIGEVPTRQDAEMALLAEASGAASQLVGQDPSFFAELSVSRGWTRVLSPITGKPRELGYVCVDRLFPVKGVGPVALGFTFASISVHQELRAIPSGKLLQVRSIQVLDEDQEEVGLGIRVGLALKGAQMEELQGTYALEVAEGSISVMSARFSDAKIFRWAKTLPSRFHVLAGGLKTLGELRQDVDQLSFASPLPKGARALLLDLDAGPKSSRVIGYLDLTHGGRNISFMPRGTRFASCIAF
ncbi:MAG: translation elongation factor [Thermoprotei archaeon]